MTRRAPLSLALLACLACGAQPEPQRPSFVILLADDLGWRDLGCEGSTFYETPHLDGLAASGLRFSQAYAASPLCSPTRAALLTGRSPARLGLTDYAGGHRRGRLAPADSLAALPPAEVTVAEVLREAGYRTGFFGKWHLGSGEHLPELQGFEVNVGGGADGHPKRGYFAPFGLPGLGGGAQGEHLTERLTDEALAWMESVADEPFLLYLSYYSVHTPLETKPEYEAKYAEKRAALASDAPLWEAGDGLREWRLVQEDPVYAGMIQSVDESAGRVLAKLDELGLADSTLVVFTSDNGGFATSPRGPTSNRPLRGGKGWLFEGGIRVPLLVRSPDIEPGSESAVPVTSTDLFPTLLALAGLAPRPELHTDGTSLVPLLEGRSIEARSSYWHFPHYSLQGSGPSSAVRSGEWKLIEWLEDGSTQLFHLGEDAGESVDRSEERPDVAAALRAELVEWRERVGANMPAPHGTWR